LCIVTVGFPPAEVGGTEIAAYELAKRLNKNFEVHVVTKYTKDTQFLEQRDNFAVHYVRNRLSWLRGIRFVTNFFSFIVEIRKIQPEIIYARSLTPAGFVATFYCKSYKIPCFVQCEGIDVLALPSWFKKTLGYFVVKYATKIISATKDMAKKLAQDYGRKDVIIIENGVNSSEFENAKAKDLAYEKPRVIFVGRIDENKGVEYLAKAFLQVRKNRKSASLLIVGDGPLKKELENKYGDMDDIHFLGRIPHEEIPEYLAACDLFVLPSIFEGQGLVLMEALASGLPIIASNLSGISELIIDGENGMLTKAGDENELAEKIELILDDKRLQTKISANNIKKGQLHDWKNICKQYIELFEGYKR